MQQLNEINFYFCLYASKKKISLIRKPISSPLAVLWLLVFLAYSQSEINKHWEWNGNKATTWVRLNSKRVKINCFAYAAAFILMLNACASPFILAMWDLNELKTAESKALLFIICSLSFISALAWFPDSCVCVLCSERLQNN